MIIHRYIIVLTAFAVIGCQTLKTYSDNDGPIWFNNNIVTTSTVLKKELTVVTFNIEKSEKIDLAISELTNSQEFANPDILLLQEMDEASVIKFAQTFQLNYLYFPIATHKKKGNNFGNAILSKFKLSKPSKLILPHHTLTKRIRNATNCILHVGTRKVLVYSIHNETIIMSQSKRMDQVDAILEDIASKASDIVIVGGDFNSSIPRDLKEIVRKFKESDFNWTTEKTGGTSRALFNMVEPRNDHIFTKGLTPLSTKKLVESKCSDHLPVLLSFKI